MRWGKRLTPEERVKKALDSIFDDDASFSVFQEYVNELTQREGKAMYDKGYGDGYAKGELDTKAKLITMQEAALRRIRDGHEKQSDTKPRS